MSIPPFSGEQINVTIYMMLKLHLIIFATLIFSSIKASVDPEDMSLRSSIKFDIQYYKTENRIPYPRHMINCLADLSSKSSKDLVGFARDAKASFVHGKNGDRNGVYLLANNSLFFLPLVESSLRNNHSYIATLKTSSGTYKFPFIVFDGQYRFASMKYLRRYNGEFPAKQFENYKHPFETIVANGDFISSLATAVQRGAIETLKRYNLDRQINTQFYDEGNDKKTVIELCRDVAKSYKISALERGLVDVLKKFP